MKKYLTKISLLVMVCVLLVGNVSYVKAATLVTDGTFSFQYNKKVKTVSSSFYVKKTKNQSATLNIKKTDFKAGEVVEFYLCDEKGNRVTNVVKYKGKGNVIKLVYLPKICLVDNTIKRYRLVGTYKGGKERTIEGKIIL